MKFVHLVYGNQPLLIQETIQKLTHQHLQESSLEMGLHTFDVDDLLKNEGDRSALEKISELRMAFEESSLFVSQKVIHLKQAHKLKLSAGKKAVLQAPYDVNEASPSSQLYQLVYAYLHAVPAECLFLLSASVEKESELSSPLLKACKAQGGVHKHIQYEEQIPQAWIQQCAKKRGVFLNPGSETLLVELVGNDLGQLEQTIEKLSLQTNHISEDLILQQVTGTKNHSVFRITQSLSNRSLLPALETLTQVLEENPREHVKIFVLLYQQLRKLLMICMLQEQGAADKVIISKLKMHPFLARKLIPQAQQFQKRELQELVSKMAQMDLRLKYQSSLGQVLLQDLFEQICQ